MPFPYSLIRTSNLNWRTEKEIVEAMEVAYEMGVGSVTVNSRFGLEVMESLYHNKMEE